MRGIPADGDTIRRLRRARSWTQEHLAEVCGCSLRTVTSAERGAQVDVDTLGLLASALDISLDSLANLAPPATDLERNKELILAWDDTYLDQNVGRLLEFHHRDVLLEIPGTEEMTAGGSFSGIEEMKEHLEGVVQIFPVMKTLEQRIDAVGDLVFDRLYSTVRSLITGRDFNAQHVNVMQLLDGKIIRRTTYLDLTGYRTNLVADHV